MAASMIYVKLCDWRSGTYSCIQSSSMAQTGSNYPSSGFGCPRKWALWDYGIMMDYGIMGSTYATPPDFGSEQLDYR